MSHSHNPVSSYRIDIKGEINKVYKNKHRELYREFATLQDFEKLFFDQSLSLIDENLNRYLHRGYHYLNSQADEGFVDFTHDDNNIEFNQVTTDIQRYLAENSLAHLYAHLALTLMDTTDIEDHLSQHYHLIDMSSFYLTFECRRFHATTERLFNSSPYLRDCLRRRQR